MFPQERIAGLGMFLHAERSRLEALDGMAGGTIACEAALGELSLMRIGQMAVHAFLEGDRRVEVSRLVTAFARHRPMPAEKRKSRFGMVKSRRQLHLFPGNRVVA